MPQPGEAIPYPPHPAFGGASGQYALETTLQALVGKDFATTEKQLPAGHSVTVANPTANPETGLAKETTLATRASESTLAGRFAQITPKSGDFTGVGPHDLAVPSVGANALKVVWLYAQAVAALGNSAVEVTFKLGAATLYKFELTGSQPWAHAAVLPPGAAGEKLTLTMNVAAVRVLANADVKEFTP